jgi:hypothetical protein
MTNLFEQSAYIHQIKIESRYSTEIKLTEEDFKKQMLERCPNFLHKDGRIYASKATEAYFAVSVSPINEKFESQIEKKIYPVVKELLNKNYLTVGSCEGHDSATFGDPPAIRLAFGSLESAEAFINFFKNENYVKIWVVEESRKTAQYYKNEKFYYEAIESSSVSTTTGLKDINRMFFRNYSNVWYVDIQLIKKISLLEKIKDVLFLKTSEKIRKELIKCFLKKIEQLPKYEL